MKHALVLLKLAYIQKRALVEHSSIKRLSKELRVVAHDIIASARAESHEEVDKIMMIVKGKIPAIIALLFLASSLAVASASKTQTPFYVKTFPTASNMEWMHQADDSRAIMKVTEEGEIRDAEDNVIGTFAFDIIEGISLKTGRGTASGHFTIDFDSGATVEGTLTAKIQMYLNNPYQPPDVDGKFVGHGDMHVMGDLYLDSASLLIFDGYSW